MHKLLYDIFSIRVVKYVNAANWNTEVWKASKKMYIRIFLKEDDYEISYFVDGLTLKKRELP